MSSFLAALLRKRARRSGSSSDADLRRKFRGDLIRQRLKRAVGRNWMGQTMSLGRSNDATDVDTRERDFAGDRLRSTRDIAFARASGLVRADKTKPREEDVAWTLAATRRNAVAAAEFAAVSRGERLNGASMTSPPRSQSQSRQQQQQQQQSSTDVPITLCVTCPVRPGQRVAVLGEPAAFGGWDASRAALLDRVGEDRWQKACRVPAGEMEYRYALVYVRPNGEVVLETEVGGPRTRRVSSDAGPGGGNALMIDETSPVFGAPAGASPARGERAPARRPPRREKRESEEVIRKRATRVAERHDVDVDTALEVLRLVKNDERLAGKLLGTMTRGIGGGGGAAAAAAARRAPAPARARASPPPSPRRADAWRPTTPVAEDDRTAAAANSGSGYDPDVSETFMSSDVKVVEDLSDVSDEELARLIGDLQRELDES